MDPNKQNAGNFDFQDFSADSTLVELDTSDQHTHTFKQFPDSAVDDDLEGDVEENKLLGDDKPAGGGGGAIWTVEYYRQYFNVDTNDVRDRCLWSMVPKPGTNFLKDRLQHNPDLYGPFWIGTTLVISIAVMGNLANYLQVAGDPQYHWRYDFHKLTLAATAVFCYSVLVPIALWAVFWWRGAQASVTLLQLVCLYGYSLTVYIPISVLCASGIWQLQWALMLVGFAVSGAVLAISLWSALGEEQRNLALAVTAVVLVLHLALAAGFLLYFFRAPVPTAGIQPTTAAAVAAASSSEKTAAVSQSASQPAAPAAAAALEAAAGNTGSKAPAAADGARTRRSKGPAAAADVTGSKATAAAAPGGGGADKPAADGGGKNAQR